MLQLTLKASSSRRSGVTCEVCESRKFAAQRRVYHIILGLSKDYELETPQYLDLQDQNQFQLSYDQPGPQKLSPSLSVGY